MGDGPGYLQVTRLHFYEKDIKDAAASLIVFTSERC
jgi:hypothetical protein